VTGYGETLGGKEFATIVAYFPATSADELEHFWPESDGAMWDGYDFQWRDEIAFTSRFPRPDWFDAIAGEARSGETVEQGSTGTASTRAEGIAHTPPPSSGTQS
jgi:hypothetical protein